VVPSFAIGLHLYHQRQKNMLCDQRTLDRYGFLYTSFHSDALWWSAVMLTKQAFLVIIQVNLWNFPALQGLLLIMVLMFTAVLGMYVRPNLEPTANWLEVGGDCLKILVVALGLIFNLEAVENDERDDTAMFVMIFYLFQGLYLVFAVYYTVQDTKKVIRRQHVRLRGVPKYLARSASEASLGDLASPENASLDTHAQVQAVLKRAKNQFVRRPSFKDMARNVFATEAEESLEVIDTLEPALLDRYVSSPAFQRAAARERASLVELNAALEEHALYGVAALFFVPSFTSGPRAPPLLLDARRGRRASRRAAAQVSDASPSSNFSNSHDANFYRRLQNFLPCLCDVARFGVPGFGGRRRRNLPVPARRASRKLRRTSAPVEP